MYAWFGVGGLQKDQQQYACEPIHPQWSWQVTQICQTLCKTFTKDVSPWPCEHEHEQVNMSTWTWSIF